MRLTPCLAAALASLCISATVIDRVEHARINIRYSGCTATLTYTIPEASTGVYQQLWESADGQQWRALKGESVSDEERTFRHRVRADSEKYFRVLQLDYDGTESRGPIVVVRGRCAR